MRHSASRPTRPAAHRGPLPSALRAVGRLSGLLVLALTLIAAAGVVVLVHEQPATSGDLHVAAASRTEHHPRNRRAGTAADAADHDTLRQPTAGEDTTNTNTDTKTAENTATAGQAGTADVASQPGQEADGDHRHAGDHRRENGEPDVQQDPNPNCTLLVPAGPTTAAGLAAPYYLRATGLRAGPCHEANAAQSAFVEAAIISPSTGAVSIYHPLVVDQGAQPAAAPVPVPLPPGAVVGIWFGFNGDTLTLAGPGAGDCVNGLPGSPFGQFAYCKAPEFFQASQHAIAAHLLTVPALGTGSDGLPCPTTRDFAVVDQDQSDNLATAYRIVNSRMGQDTDANRAGKKLTNGSDEGLLANAIDKALGCQPWKAPDLGDPGSMVPSLALNELSAAAHQAQAGPEALVPLSDPMVKVDDRVSIQKTNLYRAGVDQPAWSAGQTPQAYCRTLRLVAPPRLLRDAALFRVAASASDQAPNLLQFLRARLQGTFEMLDC